MPVDQAFAKHSLPLDLGSHCASRICPICVRSNQRNNYRSERSSRSGCTDGLKLFSGLLDDGLACSHLSCANIPSVPGVSGSFPPSRIRGFYKSLSARNRPWSLASSLMIQVNLVEV